MQSRPTLQESPLGKILFCARDKLSEFASANDEEKNAKKCRDEAEKLSNLGLFLENFSKGNLPSTSAFLALPANVKGAISAVINPPSPETLYNIDPTKAVSFAEELLQIHIKNPYDSVNDLASFIDIQKAKKSYLITLPLDKYLNHYLHIIFSFQTKMILMLLKHKSEQWVAQTQEDQLNTLKATLEHYRLIENMSDILRAECSSDSRDLLLETETAKDLVLESLEQYAEDIKSRKGVLSDQDHELLTEIQALRLSVEDKLQQDIKEKIRVMNAARLCQELISSADTNNTRWIPFDKLSENDFYRTYVMPLVNEEEKSVLATVKDYQNTVFGITQTALDHWLPNFFWIKQTARLVSDNIFLVGLVPDPKYYDPTRKMLIEKTTLGIKTLQTDMNNLVCGLLKAQLLALLTGEGPKSANIHDWPTTQIARLSDDLEEKLDASVYENIIKAKVIQSRIENFNKSPEWQTFYKTIRDARTYGEQIKREGTRDKDDDRTHTGQAFIDFSEELRTKVHQYIITTDPDPDALNVFKASLKTTLTNKESSIKEHYALWKPVLGNVALAITVLPVPVMIVKALYGYLTHSSLFFFSETKRQQKADAILEKMNKIADISPPPA